MSCLFCHCSKHSCSRFHLFVIFVRRMIFWWVFVVLLSMMPSILAYMFDFMISLPSLLIPCLLAPMRIPVGEDRGAFFVGNFRILYFSTQSLLGDLIRPQKFNKIVFLMGDSSVFELNFIRFLAPFFQCLGGITVSFLLMWTTFVTDRLIDRLIDWLID